jgi:hypothetical protein
MMNEILYAVNKKDLYKVKMLVIEPIIAINNSHYEIKDGEISMKDFKKIFSKQKY